jgi:hypothetical protein
MIPSVEGRGRRWAFFKRIEGGKVVATGLRPPRRAFGQLQYLTPPERARKNLDRHPTTSWPPSWPPAPNHTQTPSSPSGKHTPGRTRLCRIEYVRESKYVGRMRSQGPALGCKHLGAFNTKSIAA